MFENKLDDPKKGLPKLRLLYSHILRPRYLYACSAERTLFYDMAWTGLEAGEFRPVNSFLSLGRREKSVPFSRATLASGWLTRLCRTGIEPAGLR